MKNLKTLLRYLMALFYILAGTNHFINPDFYIRIMPSFIPWHVEIVWITGVLEVVLGIMVLIPAWVRVASWGLILLLITIFPANINMAFNENLHFGISPIWLYLRLPLQFVLIAWAYGYTKSSKVSEKMGRQ
jgi:uncharacterized membrane protein